MSRNSVNLEIQGTGEGGGGGWRTEKAGEERSEGEYQIPEHNTGARPKDRGTLPVAPACPGPGALGANDTVQRPKVSKEFRKEHPGLVGVYSRVAKKGVPNYRGARVKLASKLNLREWAKDEEKFSDKSLIEMLMYGFPIGYTSKDIPEVDVQNHMSAKQHPLSVGNYIEKEVNLGALIGPLREGPFTPWTRKNPLMTRPKDEPNLRRVILDLSYPEGKSVNDGIPAGLLDGAEFQMRLPSPFDLARKIVQYGPDVLLYKADLRRAYRQLRSDPLDWPFLALEWQGKIYLDVAIPFGLRHGASACQRTTEAIAAIVEEDVAADTLPYIDDTAGIAYPVAAWLHYETLISTISRLGLEPAMDKCAAPSTQMVWIGVTYDTIRMTMAIVPEKVEEALEACRTLLQKEMVSLWELQSLVGKILHASKCTTGAKVFASRLLDLVSVARFRKMVRLSEEARADLAWFGAFLHAFNGITLMKPEVAQRVVHVDSCLGGGGGGLCDGLGYYKIKYPNSITRWGFSINALECLNALIAIRLWMKEWAGLTVLIFVDNWATVCALNSGRAQDPVMRGALREVWWLAAMADVNVIVRHKPGSEMETADTLSRASLSESCRARFEKFAEETVELQRSVTWEMLRPPLPI